MKVIANGEYQRLSNNLVWKRIAKEMPSTGRKERLIWLLDAFKIQYVPSRLGSYVEFEDQIALTTEYESQAATGGLKLNRFQLEDHDGGGVQLASEWARQAGAYAAYWPQKQVMKAIRDGSQAASLAYDGIVFFKNNSSTHPLNPFDTSLGTYANLFTGAASGAYPGALPIHESGAGAVTLDVAFQNLQKALTYIRSIKMASGEDPRMLRASALLVPPALSTRVAQLTNAKFIAQAAASGGGSSDVEAVVRSWNLAEPIVADELGAGFTNGSDTSWYILTEGITSDSLGALTYVNREPFQIVYNTGMTDADLQRANELQWVTRGRNVVGYGHPYLLFRADAT